MVKRICILLVCCVMGVDCCGSMDSNNIGKAVTADGNDIKEAAAGFVLDI